MGKPHHRAIATNQLASNDGQAQRRRHDAQQTLELVLTSMCVAVETRANQSQDDLEAPSSPEDALVRIYRENMRKQPLERALSVVNDWSLAKFQTNKSLFQKEIAYPADAKPAPAVDQQLTQEEQAESPKKKQQLKKRQRVRAPTAKSDGVPELFRTAARIDEDPLEARWDHRGNPVPLRRNILGEHYAPYKDPLRFIKKHKERSPAEIYQQMKLAVRANLKDRERRRIQALNDRERLRRQQLEAQGVLSPEAALEAKFDRMFVEAERNNEPQKNASNSNSEGDGASLRKGGKVVDTGSSGKDNEDASDDAGDDEKGNGEQQQESEEGDEDTDDASDSEANNNQQQRRAVRRARVN